VVAKKIEERKIESWGGEIRRWPFLWQEISIELSHATEVYLTSGKRHNIILYKMTTSF